MQSNVQTRTVNPKCLNIMMNKNSLSGFCLMLLAAVMPFLNGHGQTKASVFLLSDANLHPKYETRAVWLTTLNGLDWPRTKATSSESRRLQQEELCRQLDSLKAANFNTVLLQVRSRDNALYPSRQEVFTDALTGTPGQSPGYDPLDFAIRECHKRGMELHAWVVAIPLGSDKQAKELGKRSFVRKHPEMCIRFRRNWYLDPGHPETKNHLAAIVEEIVTNYDVDGINLDYIRYPDHPKRFPDGRSYRKYGKGKSLAQWRRDNITEIVRHIYHRVKAIKPWVKVGSSPVGKYKDVARYSSRGWNAHNVVFQDAQLWLKEGIQDLMLPMAYFREDSFYPFVLDWQENGNGRTVVPGLGIYFLDPGEGDWTLQDALQQIYFTRSAHIPGQAYFRSRFLLDNVQGLYDKLKREVYAYPALVPPMAWQDTVPPAAPTGLRTEVKADSVIFTWNPVADDDSPRAAVNPVVRYNLYAASSGNEVDTNDPRNLKYTYIYGTRYAAPLDEVRGMSFAVTAVDAYGNESRMVPSHNPVASSSAEGATESLDLPDYPQATRLVVVDLYERIVWQGPYARSLDIGHFVPGVYYVLMQDRDGNTLRRVQFIR